MRTQDPSTPNVTFLLPTTNSIQLNISMGDSIVDEYEICSTTNVSGIERNCSICTKSTTIDFNKNILSTNCNITAVAGMCFDFQISAIRGHAISDAFSESNICFSK
ncbi:hypothetical protein CHS0354_009150 [Potamilus streckersoni]|uniref:Uncharacterized protein n=1 Tax=Potamilus streckersoni TaxID=2493646 RepID=A0AAE0SSE0_9BIVA|nr:hypothetical protein CHS0354_009150 [Potamilus streckersoni]